MNIEMFWSHTEQTVSSKRSTCFTLSFLARLASSSSFVGCVVSFSSLLFVVSFFCFYFQFCILDTHTHLYSLMNTFLKAHKYHSNLSFSPLHTWVYVLNISRGNGARLNVYNKLCRCRWAIHWTGSAYCKRCLYSSSFQRAHCSYVGYSDSL